jgi:ATP-dependent Lhr-like helicase
LRSSDLEEPPDIVVTTSESLSLLLTLKDRLKVWSNVGWVIVDEVHEMLESERVVKFKYQ